MLIGIDARMYGFSGIGTYLKALLKGLNEIDNENRYVCYCFERDAKYLKYLGENFSVKVSNIPIYSLREQLFRPLQGSLNAFDLFHFPHYSHPIFNGVKRRVITIHDIIHYLFPQYLPNRLANYYARFMISASLKKGDAILADSENTKNDLIKHFNADPSKIEVVYPGLLPVDSRQRPESDLERLSGFNIKTPYILYVGNAKEHKNLPLLIRAFELVRQRTPCHLAITCGKDEIKGAVRLPEGQASGVNFLGHVKKEELDHIYQNASLFAFPSLYEGFGYPPLEAMQGGVPVVSSDAASLPEVLGDAALYVSPNSVEQLADSIFKVLTDNEIRKSLIQKGKERTKRFHYREMAGRVLKIYNEVCGSKR